MIDKKITVVVGVMNQFEIAEAAINLLMSNCEEPDAVDLLVIDNASDTPFEKWYEERNHNMPFALNVLRLEENCGNYPIFKLAAERSKTPVTAFFHSDLLIHQFGWDTTIIKAFTTDEELGLIGFIGSTDLDHLGGRGMGTVSNFQGATYGKWQGSPAHVHGKVDSGLTIHGSVVDGCAMVFRTSVLKNIQWEENFPPHHFYDRMMSVQVLELGYKVGILGIGCDHISGQTANQESSWHNTAKKWAKDNLGIDEPEQYVNVDPEWFANGMNPSNGQVPHGFDHVIYLEAERRFLKKYRDELHLIPRQYGKRTA